MVSETGQTPSRTQLPLKFLTGRVRSALAVIRQLPRSIPAFLQWAWTRQRHWLVLLVPLLFLIYRPFRLAWGIWFSFDSPLAIQAFVPLLALYMAWEQRETYTRVYREFCSLWPPESKKRHGQVWIALLGCLMMVIASIAIVPSLAILAFAVLVIGTIYYVYGWFVLRMLWAPLLFLLLITPPGNLLFRVLGPFQIGNAVGLEIALRPLFSGVKTLGNVVLLPNTRLIVTSSLSGLSVAVPIMVLTVWLALRRKVLYYNYPVLLLLGLVVALLVNFVRLWFLAVIINTNPTIGNGLMQFNSWILVFIAFLLVRSLVDRFRPRSLTMAGAEGDGR